MPKTPKRRAADLKGWDPGQTLPLSEAVAKVQSFQKGKFDQSVELCLHLGIDPRQADQLVRGSLALPHGIGKTKRVIAFCRDDVVDAAKQAGAIEAGGRTWSRKSRTAGWISTSRLPVRT